MSRKKATCQPRSAMRGVDKPTQPRPTHKDLEGLGAKLEERFGWKLRAFQLEAIEAQLLGKDVIVHAGTGAGKTAIAAGPHVLPMMEGRVTIMVSPLLALQNEQVNTFMNEFKLDAIAINSSHGGCTPEALTVGYLIFIHVKKLADMCHQRVSEGKHQIVLISPEMLLSKRFIDDVLRKKSFTSRVVSVVVDEAHVVSRWGAGFRKKYGELGMVQAFLPRGTPIVALSATLPPRIHTDVLNKLQFPKDGYTNLNVGNDRPNVSLVTRAIEHPMNTYADLDFVIPGDITDPKDIPKTFIYADSVSMGIDIEDHLTELLPENLRDKGLIRPFNAAFSHEYRAKLMDLFNVSEVRVLICTDAAGMGCNIPDIDVVVQWKLPDSVSTFVQRAGRAARADGHEGLAILLAEKSAYMVDVEAELKSKEKAVNPKGDKRKKQINEDSQKKKASKAYAVAHGVLRGAFGGQTDSIPVVQQPPLDTTSMDEGLYVLIQTTSCRRKVLTHIYNNALDHPTMPCCDLCDPSLLNRTRPGPPPLKARQTATKQGEPAQYVQHELHKWRTQVYERDFTHAMFGPSAIMKDGTITMLSSVGPISSICQLEKILAGQWQWYATYGAELLAFLNTLEMPDMVKKKRKAGLNTKKRKEQDGLEDDGGRGKRARKPTMSASTASTSQAASATPAPTSQAATPAPNPAAQTATRPRGTPNQFMHSATPSTPIPTRLQQNPYAHLVYTPHQQYLWQQPHTPIVSCYPNTPFYRGSSSSHLASFFQDTPPNTPLEPTGQ
ncbi:uncharacterized protein LACBIDRAFT_298348 [Laccaria bicolor S238N-H82]|uniref:DNA 3'-5' helicase n=1 Tax=Laccaria bicolor (strain S238N-H82 / ATCC MYA-4686) TaxID=486041 RepID=B0E3B7_LACBS|nr:uncharacterized protein LACBIDRAFT_298348 [Laccaria bicolor S238N-H82]EDQ98673.1 predicted protein [Laccaria bicolor S238N-H82]|eukprot:XP_001890686.1 predicted protein [Laccaria bicolor S238N-H82]